MHPTIRLLVTSFLALTAMTALLGACSDDGDVTGSSTEDSIVEPSEGGANAVDGEEEAPDVASVTTGIGTILADADGLTLYASTEDGELSSGCTDECTDTWPPLLVEDGDTIVASNVDGELVTTFERDDGTVQVAIDGHPLYRYADDEERHDVNGHEVGGIWFVVTPVGELVTEGRAVIDTHGDIYGDL
jgi:predicted lipoprotein with Yx(FWY)xxD motif